MSESNSPPCVDIAEQAIIATVCADPSRFLPRLRAAGVTTESFWTHRQLFGEIEKFIDAQGGFESIAFIQAVTSKGVFDSIGGMRMMDAIQYPAYSPAGWSTWVEQLQEAHALRIAYFLHAGDGSYENSEEARNALEMALESISKAKSGPIRLATAKDAVEAFRARFVAMAEVGEIPGHSTGIQPLDQYSGGMRPGELWIICGQTSRGKSVLMLQLAAEMISENKRALIFSLEMGKGEVVGRLCSYMGRIDYTSITQPRTSNDREKGMIVATLKQLKERNFWVDDSAGQTMDHIAVAAREMRDVEGDIDVIVIDYLQYVTPDPRRKDSREQEVARISRAMKQLAKEMNCPVITGAQLNKDGETRESQAISQDADALLFIVDDGIKIGKLRNGKRDDVMPLILDGRYQRFCLK